MEKRLTAEQQQELITILQKRFEKNRAYYEQLEWQAVQEKLEQNPEKLWSLYQMEETGGEPNIIAYDAEQQQYTYVDCAPETPKGRRSYCYDRAALEGRKKFPPKNSVLDVAQEMGITLLTEQQYRQLQQFAPVDQKTSSWIMTPQNVRELGGALFCDYRYGQVFVYHNGADSYYASRGFRGALIV